MRRSVIRWALSCVILAVALPATAQEPEEGGDDTGGFDLPFDLPFARNQDRVINENQVVVLRGLDKVTARISRQEVKIGDTLRFGSLEITPRDCYKRPPEEQPETTAFLEITDAPKGRDPETIFTGWMFASSPALNPLDHAVFDVWLIDCKAWVPPVDQADKGSAEEAQN